MLVRNQSNAVFDTQSYPMTSCARNESWIMKQINLAQQDLERLFPLLCGWEIVYGPFIHTVFIYGSVPAGSSNNSQEWCKWICSVRGWLFFLMAGRKRRITFKLRVLKFFMLHCSLSSSLSMTIRFIFSQIKSVVSRENSKYAVQKVKYLKEPTCFWQWKPDLPIVVWQVCLHIVES